MLTKFVVAFAILALVAFAGSIPGKVASGNVTLTAPSVIHGTAMKAGSYRVNVVAGKAIFSMAGETREIAAKVETGDKKFDSSKVQYEKSGSQTTITEICLGGTKVRLVFN